MSTRRILVILLGGFSVMCLFIDWYSSKNDYFNRAVFEAVVERIRQSNLQTGIVTEFKLEDMSNPGSLRPVKPGEVFTGWHGAGLVDALRDANGDLKVVIRTRDNWHFGQGGFAYSDKPMAPEQDDEGKWFLFGLPTVHETKPGLKIDNHWWRLETSGQ